MTTEKDAREHGYTPNNDGTWSKEGSNDKYLTQEGDTGQWKIKNISGNDVWHDFDKKKD